MTVTFKQFATYLSAPDDATPAQLDEIWDRILGKKKADAEAEDEDDDKDPKNKNVNKVIGKKEIEDKRKELAAKRKKELEDKRNQAWAASKERADGGRKGTSMGDHRHAAEDDWRDTRSRNSTFGKLKEAMPLTEKTDRQTYRRFEDWKAAAKKLDLDKADVAYIKDAEADRDHNLASPQGMIVAKWNPTRKEGWTKMATVKEGKQSYSDEGYWKDDAKAAGFKVKKLSGNLDSGDQTWGAFKDDKKMGEFTEVEENRGGWLMTESRRLKEDEEETGLASMANQPEFQMSRDDKMQAQKSGEAYASALRKKNKEPDWNKVKAWGKSFKSGFRMGWGTDDKRLA